MKDISAWVGLIGGLIGFVVFLGAAVVFLRGSKDKGTITTLEASNAALAERVDILSESEGRLKADVVELQQRVQTLENENAELRQQRPSAEMIADLAARLEKHDTDTLAAISGLKGQP